MPYPAFTGGVANINPSSFVAVYIRAGSGEKWQTLGSIQAGTLNLKDFSAADSLGRNKAINSYDFTAKFNMMQCASTELKLVDNICSGGNDFLFKLPNAVAITGSPVASAGWRMVTAAQVGAKAKVVADGSPDKNREIQIELQGSIFKSDANEVLFYTPTLQATDFEATGSGGTFHGIGTYTAATDGGSPTMSHIVPAGLSSVTFDLAGGASPVTITPVNNIKFSLEMLAVADSVRAFRPVSLSVDITIDWMATLSADLLLLGNGTVVDVKAIFTFLDGEAFTFDNQTGIEGNYEVSGDMDKNQFAQFALKGKTLQATIGTIAS
jgi:hypothetical protein